MRISDGVAVPFACKKSERLWILHSRIRANARMDVKWEVSLEVLDPQRVVNPDLSEYRVEDAVSEASAGFSPYTNARHRRRPYRARSTFSG